MIVITACFGMEIRWIDPTPDGRLLLTPMGERAPEALDEVARSAKPVSLLLAGGFCGAADPKLKTGDLVLADVIHHRGEALRVCPELIDRVKQAQDRIPGHVWVGPCASIDRVADPDAKAAVYEQGGLTVDMESGPLARWAREHGVPFLAFRAVLDPVGTSVPFSPDRPTWATMIRHPWSTLDLAQRSVVAGRALGRATTELIRCVRKEVGCVDA